MNDPGRPPGAGRLAAALVVATLAGAGVAACDDDDAKPTSAHSSARSSTRPGGVAWGSCPPSVKGTSRLVCGTLKVPLDYRHPDGTTIDVAVSRLSTAQPGRRRGVLVLNPGGPGLGGLGLPATVASALPKPVLDGYDLVGFDPRGVEHSTPQSCGLANPTVYGLFPYPAADGSIGANVTRARADAAQCATKAGDKLRYFTTANTARDLDRIRQALGVPKISYWGQSYGTYLGAVYRSLFPDRTDRMILEGNVNPSKVWADEVADTWGKGMADRFPDAARVAAAQASTLKLGRNVKQVTRTYLALAARLDRKPVPLDAQTSMDGALLRSITYAMLLHNDTLAPLTRFWRAAADLADGRPTAADQAVLKQVLAAGPTTPGVAADNQATMFLALTCGDVEWSHDVASYAPRVAADRRKWPLTAGMPAGIWPCAFWKKPIEPPVAVRPTGARDTLILQNRRDNATPWEGGLGLHRALGDRAAFVGVNNGGHYVFGQGSSCADTATVTFLTTGRLPAKDVYCTDVTQK
jgi:pimeloyl-ACP methyl ester carboxylesterase